VTEMNGTVMDALFALKITGANVGDVAVSEQLDRELLAAFPDSIAYHLEPPGGDSVKAAFDWVFLSRVTDLVTIATAVWAVYDRVIQPRRARSAPAALVVAVDAEQGLQWVIGQDAHNRETFVDDCVVRVGEFQRTPRASLVLRQAVSEVQSSRLWAAKGKAPRTTLARKRQSHSRPRRS